MGPTSKALDWLILPGYQGSGPQHWQSLWIPVLSGARVVHQNWHQPNLAEWVANLDKAIRACREPPVLVAHSLGVLAVAHWSRRYDARIRAAFLVAPPDLDNPAVPPACRAWAATPRGPLPFPSVVVASENDPYSAFERTRNLAWDWQSTLTSLGAQGHINVESGHGPWAQGLKLLMKLVESG
jgi:hypothetical protein